MASEYTEHFNLDLYTDNDRPNLRDQYNAAIRKIDNKMFDQVTTINLLDSVVDNLTEDVQQMQTDLTNEVTARTNADTALGTRIDNETTARESADQTLTTDLAAEVTAREGADTTLDNKITAETTARTNADTAETTARTNADTALSDRIDANDTSISTLTTDLAAEIAARTALDGRVGTLENTVDNLSIKKKIIVIGDSYISRGSMQFINDDLVARCNADYIRTAKDFTQTIELGGTGFLLTGAASFRYQADAIIDNSTSDERSTITDVVFAGGWNDGNHYYDRVDTNESTIKTTINYVRDAFPNARVWLYYMYCGGRLYSSYSNNRRRNFTKAGLLWEHCAKATGAGFGWCNSLPYILGDNATDDNIHPTTTAMVYLRALFARLVTTGQGNDYVINDGGAPGNTPNNFDKGDFCHTRKIRVFNWNFDVDVEKTATSEFYNSTLVDGYNNHVYSPIITKNASDQFFVGWIEWYMKNDNHIYGKVQQAQGVQNVGSNQHLLYFLDGVEIMRYNPQYDVSN